MQKKNADCPICLSIINCVPPCRDLAASSLKGGSSPMPSGTESFGHAI